VIDSAVIPVPEVRDVRDRLCCDTSARRSFETYVIDCAVIPVPASCLSSDTCLVVVQSRAIHRIQAVIKTKNLTNCSSSSNDLLQKVAERIIKFFLNSASHSWRFQFLVESLAETNAES